MNARACQLCGKPLSRLRVGGDGDFCSKDHRNQFRLRAGMDRLVEVNKVASLMRRRESARPILPSSLIREGLTTPHSFDDMFPGVTRDAVPQTLELRTPASVVARISSDYSSAQLNTSPARSRELMPRSHTSALPMPRGQAVQPRMRRQRPATKVALTRREASRVRCTPAAAPGGTRDFNKLPSPALRTHLGEIPDSVSRPGKAWTTNIAGPRELKQFPMEGNALRVSVGMGFRVPRATQPNRLAAPVTASELVPVHRAQPLTGIRTNIAILSKSLELDRTEFDLILKPGPAPNIVGEFSNRPAMNLNGRMFRDMPAPEPRGEALKWALPEPKIRKSGVSQSGAGFSRRNGVRFSRLPVKPMQTEFEQHLASAPIVAREELCVPRVRYCNVLAAAVSTEGATTETPAPLTREAALAPVEAVQKFEEHFDAGWDNWVGGTADWKVDVAGVRTGSLALYLPTLDLSDYDLEFLGRIDNRSINWVVRASGSEEHIRCTISLGGGQFEFSRAVVRGGVAEAPTVSSTRLPGKPRATFTVRMNIAGPVFGVSVDGKTIDSWVDDRLATGGIGFMGAADDRARLYWVRVSSPGTPSKEHNSE